MTMSEQTNKPSGFPYVCKKARIFLLIIAAALVIMGVGDLLGATAYLPAKYSETLKSNAAWKTAEMYLTFWGTWAVMLLALLIPVNRPIYGALGTKVKGNTWKHLGLGILIGFGMNALCIGVAALTDCIHLSYNSFEPVSFLLVFAAVFIQSSAEEVVCRGFIYQHLRHQFASPAAILCNSVLFSALHLTNPGVTALALINNTLVGILLTMTVYYFDSFWCAAATSTLPGTLPRTSSSVCPTAAWRCLTPCSHWTRLPPSTALLTTLASALRAPGAPAGNAGGYRCHCAVGEEASC